MTKTKGQIEDAITKIAIKFYFDILGVGPMKAKTYIIEDMIIVRLNGNLLPIEKKLLKGKRGVEVVKNIRQNIHELTISEITKSINDITGHNVVSAHRDISTRTGEIAYIFVLDNNYQKMLEKKYI